MKPNCTYCYHQNKFAYKSSLVESSRSVKTWLPYIKMIEINYYVNLQIYKTELHLLLPSKRIHLRKIKKYKTNYHNHHK